MTSSAIEELRTTQEVEVGRDVPDEALGMQKEL